MDIRDLEYRIEKLERKVKCSKIQFVDELPTGNKGNGFVVYEGSLYYYNNGWINLSEPSELANLPVYLNDTYAVWGGLEIGDLYLADPLNTEGWDAYSIRQVQMTPSYFIYNDGVVDDAKLLFTPANILIFSTTVPTPNYTVGATTIAHNDLRGVVFGSDFLGVTNLTNNFLRSMFRSNLNVVNPTVDLSGLNNVTIVGTAFCQDMFQGCTSLTHFNNEFNLPENITHIATVFGNSFCRNMFLSCLNLTILPDNFNLPQTINYVAGGNFCTSMFQSCSSLTKLPTNFSLKLSITFCGSGFCSLMFSGCSLLSSINSNFELPNIVTLVGASFMNNAFQNCTNLTSDSPSENLAFPPNPTSTSAYAVGCFGGTCPITPDSPTPLSSVPIKRG